MTDKHLKYWVDRYAKQGDNTILHVNANSSEASRSKIQQEWDHVEPRIEHACMQHLRMNPSSSPRLLDFGCGIGRWYPLLSSVNTAGKKFRYVGVDIVPDAVLRAQAKNPGGEFYWYDFENMLSGRPDKSFSLIFTCTVLQHIVNPDLLKRTAIELNRLLANAGTLIMIENASAKPDLPHIAFRGCGQYIDLFPTVMFDPPQSLILTGEVHLLYIGHKI